MAETTNTQFISVVVMLTGNIDDPVAAVREIIEEGCDEYGYSFVDVDVDELLEASIGYKITKD